MKTCAFCQNDTDLNGRKFLENDLASAFLNKMPIVEGHTLIIPKRCVATIDELVLEELKAIFDLRSVVRELFQKKLGAEGFNYAWNEGAMAGQSVPHLHLHILPRKTGDKGIYEYEPRRFLYRPDQERPLQKAVDMAEFLNYLKS